MGNISESSDGADNSRPNPLLARDHFFQHLRDLGERVLPSDEGAQIIRFKNGLVVSLFVQHGDFWREIESMRKKWRIEASTQLVPTDIHTPWPVDPATWDRRREWQNDILGLRDRIIPQRYLDTVDWARFIPACVLYDPPDDKLIEFAYFGGPYPWTPLPVSPEEQEAMGDNWHLLMIAPPVKSLADPGKAALRKQWLYETIIQKIGQRYLEPLGIDIWELYEEVLETSPDILKVYGEMRDENPPRLYIDVREWTTENDVRNAFRLIRQTQPVTAKVGRLKIDPLVAVQCAILYDQHNQRKSEDSRQWKWIYEKLAEQFGLNSKRAVKQRVELGREILEKKTRVQ
jgi:hypothetical protein